MKDIIPLSTLQEGQFGMVETLRTTGQMRRRLQDIGVIQGTPIECVQKSPAGDPVAYVIRGAIIALRADDAAGILIRQQA